MNRADQSPVAPPAARATIVFDGVCLLCNGWVKFLLRHDRRGRYRFAAMQGQAGRALLQQHGLDPDDPLSFLLVDTTGAWTDSDAIVRVLAGLGGLWRLSGVLRLIPRRVRDLGYRLIARNRYRWFGRSDHCMLPTPEQHARFLD
ncbi:thiol-disulfide oxidoreductase DCC family protein [Xanthomonas campestris pv. paulliniae]|uniref:thiol-disulfide oxidoreductase DCC family protein n=1 Tax=Xanthomonas euvesicatoria TaxID=456327 RepID=UPI001C454924|nr:thiol-disulfide oxidoreductase DCC family protein [Xanthomonas euvesicatoria]MBV6809763.1 thiol-disulfide oxidoreductase DCC family protein [Xanthomonas campestris pv. pennamericanum]MBV6845029.1 thiol-disulfide oxidoreductase DCC family protein [Xanthomonas campestris pv. paulliniae]